MKEQIIIQEGNLTAVSSGRPTRELVRDYLQIGFRRRRLLKRWILGATIAAVLAALLLPKYEAEAKFLVQHNRVDPVLTPQADAKEIYGRDVVSEEEINSEVEILNSTDLLQQVVLASGLADPKDSKEGIADAVQDLHRHLKIEPVKRSNIIVVSYKSRSPELSANVIKNLTRLYLEKHVAVHRAGAGPDFFQGRVSEYREKLANAENKLAEFGRTEGVAPSLAKPLVVQKIREFDVTLQETRASISETERRIANLQSQISKATPRQVTAIQSVQNPELEGRLKSTLLDLELKRTELLQKYQPSYRPVQEVEQQIRQAKEAIAGIEKSPLQDQTTDLDPTYQWMRGELAKANADRSALLAKSAATEQTIRVYQEQAQQLDEKSLKEADLTRDAKTHEQNYLLYVQKGEEARITDALDQNRVVNVAIAEQPTAPALPSLSPLLYALVVWVFFLALGLLVAYFRDRFDPSFHTPAELESFLELPVLAAVARDGNALPDSRMPALT